MTVYKGYMKILKQNKGLILLYLIIFFSVTMMFQAVAKNDIPGNYQAESVKIGIVDSDGDPLARGLISYLEHFHKVTLLADDTAAMQEKLFYRLKEVCKLPEGIEPLGIVALGEPTKDRPAIDRYLEDQVFLDTYGNPWEK